MTAPWEWDLASFDHWAMWHYERRTNDGRPTKVPLIAVPPPRLLRASSTNPDTWRSLGLARHYAAQHDASVQGTGFMLSRGDPFVALDLDGCVENYSVHPEALQLVKELGTYAELSPSRTGLRLFGEGVWNGTGSKFEAMPWGDKAEVYDHARFMTVTGRHVPGTPLRIQPIDGEFVRTRLLAVGNPAQSGKRLGTRSKRAVQRGRRRDPRTIQPGERHPELMSLVAGLYAIGYTRSDIEQRAAEFNKLIPEPLPKERWSEVGKMVDWLERKSLKHEHGFWNATPILQRIREHAQANRAAPLAVLGAVLARVCATTSHRIVLPGLGHGDVLGSLNSFVALVGEPGSGKDAALGESRKAIELGDDEFVQRVGSGEGFAHVYKRRAKKDEKQADSHGEVWLRRAALFQESEVESLVIMSGRKGSTAMPELRTIWSGGSLGHAFVDEKKRLYLPSNSYRAALVVGVQPAKASPILADADAGTPQRFLWLLCADRLAPEEHGESPGTLLPPLAFTDVGESGDPIVMDVCEAARREMDEGMLERLRGRHVGSDLDGHWLLCKLKTAALLAILHGEYAVTEAWWRLADWVMQRSNEGRAVCALASQVARNRVTERRSADQAKIAVQTDQAVAEARRQRCRDGVMRKVGNELVKRGAIRESLATDLRVYMDDVLDELVRAQTLEKRAIRSSTQRTDAYRRRSESGKPGKPGKSDAESRVS
jgi:hypothetical protein